MKPPTSHDEVGEMRDAILAKLRYAARPGAERGARSRLVCGDGSRRARPDHRPLASTLIDRTTASGRKHV